VQTPRRGYRQRRPNRTRRTAAFIVLAVLVCATLSLALLARRDTYVPTLTQVRVPVEGISRTYRILQVSDLHGSRFGERQGALARLVEGRRYDAVAMTGDVISVLGADREPAVEAVSLFAEHGPVFYVRGNHDDEGVARVLEAAGAVDLDTHLSSRLGDEEGALVVATPSGAAGARRDDSDVVVVLTHVPPAGSELATLAEQPTGAALVLAGHTHAGTVRLPFVGAIVSPQMGDTIGWTRFPELQGLHISGLKRREGTWLHISPGLAPGSYAAVPSWWRFRLGTRAQLNEIVLEPAE